MKTSTRSAFRVLFVGLATTMMLSCAPESEQTAASNQVEDSFNYDTSLSVPDLMAMVIEPAADVLWDNAGWVESSAGYEELYPTTDEGWEFVISQAALVAETGNMLALPGRAMDDEAWMVYSEGMVEAGKMAMDAARRRHQEDFFQAGAQLYSVCRACHQSYNPDIVSRFVGEGPQGTPQ